jgi:glycosyltransferase involved in cell wall biosynthesis
MKNSVLMLTTLAGCPRTWKMARALTKIGFKVDILEWDREASLKSFERVDGVTVHRLKLKATYGFKVIFLLPVWWLFVINYCLTQDSDVIQPQNFDNLLPIWFLRVLKHFKIIYDLADFYADAYIPFNNAIVKKIVRASELNLVKNVSSTILPDETRLKQLGFKPDNLVIIYNSPPDNFENKYNQENHRSKGFGVFYAGGISEAQGVFLLVDACHRIDDLNLKIAGFGVLKDFLVRYIQNKANVSFLGQIPYDQVLENSSKCDCIVVLYDPRVPNMVYSSPNKLFEAMMCGKPVIVSRGTTMAKKVLRENCGLVVTFGSVEELENALRLLKSQPSLSAALGKNGRKAYLEKYDWRLMEQQITQLYLTLLRNDKKSNCLAMMMNPTMLPQEVNS